MKIELEVGNFIKFLVHCLYVGYCVRIQLVKICLQLGQHAVERSLGNLVKLCSSIFNVHVTENQKASLFTLCQQLVIQSNCYSTS